MQNATNPLRRRANAALVALGLGIAGTGAGAANAAGASPDQGAFQAAAITSLTEWSLDLEHSTIIGEDPLTPHRAEGSPVVIEQDEQVVITISDDPLRLLHEDPDGNHYGVVVSNLTVTTENGEQLDSLVSGEAYYFNDVIGAGYEHELTHVEAHLDDALGRLVLDISSERGHEATFVYEAAQQLFGIDVGASNVGGDPAGYAFGGAAIEQRSDGMKVIDGVVDNLMYIGFDRPDDEIYDVEIHDLQLVLDESGHMIHGSVAGKYDHINWRHQYSRHGELSHVLAHGIPGTSSIAVEVWSGDGPEAVIVLADRSYSAVLDIDLSGSMLGLHGQPTDGAGAVAVERTHWNDTHISLVDAMTIGATSGDETYEVAIDELYLVVDGTGHIVHADAVARAYLNGPTGPSEGVVLNPVTADVNLDADEVRLGFIGLDGNEADILFSGVVS